jgi:hypothetical protein
MARQKGTIPIEGTIGGIIFYKNKHGHLARSKGGISRHRIATEERFARTRETGTEFGYASRTGKLLRQGIKACCPGAEDGDTNFRLTAKLMKIVQADAVNVRGQRRLTSDTSHLLEGFEWKEAAKPGELLRAPATVTMDMSAGVAQCRIKDFIAGRDMRPPAGATHVALTLAVVRVDDVAGTQMNTHAVSGALSPAGGIAGELVLGCALPAGAGKVLMAGIGVEAFQEVNGELVELKDGCGFVVMKGLVL